MVQFGKKKKITDYIYTKPVIAVLFIVVVLLGRSVYARYMVERDMLQRRHVVEQEQIELRQRKEAMQEKVEYLEGDRGIEEEVRKRFDVAKEGEQVVILLGEDKEEEVEATEEVASKKWYQFWR